MMNIGMHRFGSRKFLLTVLSVFTTLALGFYGELTAIQVIAALNAAIGVYIVGESYIDSKAPIVGGQLLVPEERVYGYAGEPEGGMLEDVAVEQATSVKGAPEQDLSEVDTYGTKD